MTAFEMPPLPEPCSGCQKPAVRGTGPGELRTLWLSAPLGLTAVHVHDGPLCANAARVQRGGGRFVPEPLTQTERLARQTEQEELS
jgi:hypothetical protein